MPKLFQNHVVNFKNQDFPEFEEFDGRKIVNDGISRLIYERGFYNALPFVSKCLKEGYEISWFNTIDQLYRENWKPRTILSTLREFNSFIIGLNIDIAKMELYLASDYKSQCNMKMEYYFGEQETCEMWFRELIS